MSKPTTEDCIALLDREARIGGQTTYKIVPEIKLRLLEGEQYRDALERLARLGNGEHYGNSEGNRIAQAALEEKP